jgi:tRNA(adenine34) deaminase
VKDEEFMDEALAIAEQAAARGNTLVGAVIVKDDDIIGRGGNEATSKRHPLRHAEIEAIDDALQAVGHEALAGATLYSTMEPCPLCAWAIHSVGIKRVVLGARFADLGRTDMGSYSFEALMGMTGKEVVLETGVRSGECIERRREWSGRTGRTI